MQVALEGAQRYDARVVILDVTGLKMIDSRAAEALFRVAAALRLLARKNLPMLALRACRR